MENKLSKDGKLGQQSANWGGTLGVSPEHGHEDLPLAPALPRCPDSWHFIALAPQRATTQDDVLKVKAWFLGLPVTGRSNNAVFPALTIGLYMGESCT
jgi:hypothetical protein